MAGIGLMNVSYFALLGLLYVEGSVGIYRILCTETSPVTPGMTEKSRSGQSPDEHDKAVKG